VNNYGEQQSKLKETQFEIPDTIDLYQIFIENGLKKEIKHIAKYSYFLHLIYRNQRHTGDYVKLSTKLLRKIISYNKVLIRIKKTLVALGIIDINHSYQQYKSSKKYKITEKYFNYYSIKNLTTYIDNSPTPPLPLMKLGFSESSATTENNTLITIDESTLNKQTERLNRIKNKVTKASNNRFDDLVNNPLMPQYRYIQQNILKTKVDKEVYDQIQKMVKEKTKLKPEKVEYIKDGKKISYWKINRVMRQSIADIWIEMIKKVEYGLGTPSCPHTTNRVYSSITSFPRECRTYLWYMDRELYYIDIRNSQPFLFLYFILTELKGEITDDVQKYIDLVCSGELYEFMMKELGRIDIIKKDLSDMTTEEKWDYEVKRTKFKIDFFGKVFFSTERRCWDERKVFDEHFPTVSKVITQMKQDGHNLSVDLQKFEASIILDKVFYRLATVHGDKYAVPVHDAILCEESIKDVVYGIMMDEIENVIGYRPSLKVESLAKSGV